MADSINRFMGLREWGLLITLSLVWGGSFFFVGVAVAEVPPFTIVLSRVGFAALTLWLFALVMGIKIPPTRQVWVAFFGMGLLNNAIPFGLIVWGQTEIASGLASILNATTPLFSVVVAHFLTRDEPMTPSRILGVLFGIAGVAVLIGPEALAGLGGSVMAQIGILLAAVSYAFAAVFGRRFKSMGLTPTATATGQVTASTLLILPLALIFEAPWQLPMPSGGTWMALIGLGVLSTALAYDLYFRILATAGATNLMLVTFLVPVSAILLGSAFLAEILTPVQFVGMGLIGLGLIAIDGRLMRRFTWRRV